MPPGLGEPPARVWTAGRALLMLGGALLAQFVAGVVVFLPMLFMQEAGVQGLEPWSVPAVMLVGTLATLGILLWQRRRLGAKPLWDRTELRDRRAWLLVAGVVLLSYGITIARIYLEVDPETPALNQDVLDLITRPEAVPWGPVAVMGISIVIMAPLTEEWLFRGILQQALGEKWSFWVSVPVTSLVFGLLHWPQWWVAALYGLALGLLARRQRSLTMPMVAHGLINLSVFVLLVLSGLEMR